LFVRLVFLTVSDDQTLLTFGVLAERHHSGILGENRFFLRQTRFEQFRDTRQTTGNVTSFYFLRNKAQLITDIDGLSFLNRDNAIALESYAERHVSSRNCDLLSRDVDQTYLRPLLCNRALARRRIDHFERFQAGHFVNLAHRSNAFDDVFEFGSTAKFADDRSDVGLPRR